MIDFNKPGWLCPCHRFSADLCPMGYHQPVSDEDNMQRTEMADVLRRTVAVDAESVSDLEGADFCFRVPGIDQTYRASVAIPRNKDFELAQDWGEIHDPSAVSETTEAPITEDDTERIGRIRHALTQAFDEDDVNALMGVISGAYYADPVEFWAEEGDEGEEPTED